MTLSLAFRAYIIEWCKPQRVTTRHVERAERLFLALWGDVGIDLIDRAKGREYRAHRVSQSVSDSTVRRELGVLNAVLKHAVKEGRLKAMPIFELPPESAPREEALTQDEVQQLLALDMSPRARLAIMLFCASGHRKGAVEGLRVGKVNFAKGTIDFRDPAVKVSKKRRAIVPMADFIRPLLEEACKGRSATDFVLPEGPGLGYELKRLMVKIGRPDVAPAHVFRHSFVSWALEAGESFERIGPIVGDTMATMERQYAHQRIAKLKSVVETMNPNQGVQA